MSSTIDVHTAWHLLRALPRGIPDAPVCVQHDPHPDVWLQVLPSGEWTISGNITDDARDLLEILLPIQRQADLVIAQAGQSVDGRIATTTGHSHYITGPPDLRRLHCLRALVDAVIVGAGTIEADNPRLTVREVEGDNPTRVVLDPEGRLDQDRHVFSDGKAHTVVVRRAEDDVRTASPRADSNVLRLPVTADGFNPVLLVRVLRDNGYRRLLVEGGGTTVSRFLQAGALDRLHLAVAPMVIGSGRPSLMLEPITSLKDALRPACRHFHLGEDVLFDFDLSQPVSGVARPGNPGRLPEKDDRARETPEQHE